MRDIFEINEKTRKIFITEITLVPFLQKKTTLKARVGKVKSLYVDWLSQIQLWTTREEATTHIRLKKTRDARREGRRYAGSLRLTEHLLELEPAISRI